MASTVRAVFLGLLVVNAVVSAESEDTQAGPGAFLEQRGASIRSAASDELLDLLGVGFGASFRDTVGARLADTERDLQLTFAAMPKNAQGRLPSAGVRYMVHRALRRRRGWLVTGVEPMGAAWSSGSPLKVLEGLAPPSMIEGVQQRLNGEGFDLQEVAVLVSALEVLGHKDAMTRFKGVRAARGVAGGKDPLDAAEAQADLDTFVRSFMLGPKNASRLSSRVVGKLMSYNMTDMYPAWQSAMDFVGEVRQQYWPDGGSSPALADHKGDTAETAVEEVNARFGQFQDRECKNLKQQLLTLEDPACPGHVPLSKFYSSALNRGKWQFTESAAYLRDVGALQDDESNSASVLVANYLNGPSNCVAASGFFTLCCADECEGLLGSLEARLARPEATPDEIANIVAALPSSSEPVRGALSSPLLRLLEDIAKVHDGQVPLHGRLFAQWMHRAYPRECPYPHISNTVYPLRPLEWKWASNRDVGATPEEMRSDIAKAAKAAGRRQHAHTALTGTGADAAAPAQCSRWSEVEELVVPPTALSAISAPRRSLSSSTAATYLWPLITPTACAALVVVLVAATFRRKRVLDQGLVFNC